MIGGRVFGQVGGWLAATALATIGSITVATLPGGPTKLGPADDLGAEFGFLASGRSALIAPLSTDIIDAILGRGSYDSYFGTGDRGNAVQGSKGVAHPTLTHPKSPSITGGGPTLLAPARRPWELTLDITADRETVKPGDEILYRIIVANVGDGDFGGQSFTLQWHTPTGTVAFYAAKCENAPDQGIQEQCGSVELVSPGKGDAVHEETVTAGLATIRAHKEYVQLWRVKTNPSQTAGTQIFNHAHLSLTEKGPNEIINSRVVVVTVEGDVTPPLDR